MEVLLKIKKDITQFEQMAAQLGIVPQDNLLIIPARLGEGFIRYFELPYDIQLHHYRYKLNKQIYVMGENKEEDGLYMLNINLSNRLLSKTVGEEKMHLSQKGKPGVIFYSPGNHSKGTNEIDSEFEVIFFAFPPATFQKKLTANHLENLIAQKNFCMYAELTENLEKTLHNALEKGAMQNDFRTEGQFLQVLGDIIDLFAEREYAQTSKLNLQDIHRQFKVKEILMNNIFGMPPSLESLAASVQISQSKLKSDFKSLFGNSIYQYYLSKKMEVAKQMLAKRNGTISEIGYQLGYNNIARFSAQFKKHFGITPRQA